MERTCPILLPALSCLALSCAARRAVEEPGRAAPDARTTGAADRAAPLEDGGGPWLELFDGESLAGWEVTSFGGEGRVEVRGGAIHLAMGSNLTGVHLASGEELPRTGYELEVVAARLSGSDFFCGLTFPVGASHATLVLGGWGGSLTGLSCLDGRDASENETRSFRHYERGRDYTARVRVSTTRILAWVDGEVVVDAPITGREVGLRTEVLRSRPLGIACFATDARVSRVRLREVRQPPALRSSAATRSWASRPASAGTGPP